MWWIHLFMLVKLDFLERPRSEECSYHFVNNLTQNLGLEFDQRGKCVSGYGDCNILRGKKWNR